MQCCASSFVQPLALTNRCTQSLPCSRPACSLQFFKACGSLDGLLQIFLPVFLFNSACLCRKGCSLFTRMGSSASSLHCRRCSRKSGQSCVRSQDMDVLNAEGKPKYADICEYYAALLESPAQRAAILQQAQVLESSCCVIFVVSGADETTARQFERFNLRHWKLGAHGAYRVKGAPALHAAQANMQEMIMGNGSETDNWRWSTTGQVHAATKRAHLQACRSHRTQWLSGLCLPSPWRPTFCATPW